MKILNTLLLLLVTSIATAQYSSLNTDKVDEAMGKTKNFIVLNEETGYALGRTPVKYEPGKDVPQCYFTTLPLAQTGLATVQNKRIMQIIDASSTSEETWCAMYSKDEDQLVFGRRKFAAKKPDAIWSPIVDDDKVIFCTILGINNRQWAKYICVDENGQLSYSTTIAEASRWKLISSN